MEDKLFMSTDHQLQGYSKGTPNVTTTSARDTQTLAGQPGQGHTVPCRPVLTANCHFAQHEGPPPLCLRPGTLKRQGHTNPCRNPCRPTQSGTHSPLQTNAATPTTTARDAQSLDGQNLLPRPETHSLLTASTPYTSARDAQSLDGQYTFCHGQGHTASCQNILSHFGMFPSVIQV